MKRKGLAVGIILLFVAIAFSPVSTAQVSPPQTNIIKASQVAPVRKVTHSSDDEIDFFDFAIIWGTFEVRWSVFPLIDLTVYNRSPWNNRTINVIGYVISDHQWYFKKAAYIACNYLHLGIVGFHRLGVVAYGNIDAFS